MNKILKTVVVLSVVNLFLVLPCFSIDLDSTVTDKSRQTYSSGSAVNNTVTKPANVKQEVKKTGEPVIEQKVEKPIIIQDLPKVPNLPKSAASSTVAPLNTLYSGKMPNSEALIPCTDIVVKDLIVDSSVYKSKSTKIASASTKNKNTVKYRTAKLVRGTQIRVINKSQITDNLVEGQSVTFLSTQEINTAYFTIPKNTVFTAKVVSSHKPQMTCNGGLVGLKIVSANINGYTQKVNAGIIKLNTDNVYFSNLKGGHTYFKSVGKKYQWGKNICSKWKKTSHNLANNGAGVIIAPFPYIAGYVVFAASTVASPATALLEEGGNLVIPAKTSFTIKVYEDAQLRY